MNTSLARVTHALASIGLITTMLVVTRADSQNPPAQQPPPAPPPPPQGEPPAGRGQGRGNNPGVFPAQQRPPGDPAVVARGRTLFEATCAFCHGKDLRGGENGG